ncbi:hypothetical protein AVEN_8243-1 [Araneus ventricosus]|uniref:Uncharacterized protein n=1 Tax=Araneus ventricosus TaxID=182803 RepID=A0A4Y2L330_ARAVE|nr:hypothetical protein AVEN_8243-1 [Araneus ventricosus]
MRMPGIITCQSGDLEDLLAVIGPPPFRQKRLTNIKNRSAMDVTEDFYCPCPKESTGTSSDVTLPLDPEDPSVCSPSRLAFLSFCFFLPPGGEGALHEKLPLCFALASHGQKYPTCCAVVRPIRGVQTRSPVSSRYPNHLAGLLKGSSRVHSGAWRWWSSSWRCL